ncbi:hypothetical protein LWI28_026908 [Acer negundo]|uniref:N6-adenosine-methyltransferase MT-A70-like n=1 Tax=Acer negundo TaxID=4023 RepID=A0AAD5NQZ8_ACENE|nr:hypothetical protein LWI28_026908 [Acer negundo]KAK4843324.1 hypothetical protein QYF36_006768 [Acer negundo]
METETVEANEDTSSIASIQTVRSQLESRIETQHNTHLDVLASLQNLVPDIVSSLDLSLHLISKFNRRNFNPTPPLPEIPKLPPKPPAGHFANARHHASDGSLHPSSGDDAEERNRGGGFGSDDGGSPLEVVRAMVAVCLLQRVPFTAIDSSMLLRKLESDSDATTPAERKALRELGGEEGEILAVEMALRSIEEESGGVELEEFSVSGKSRVMVLGIDRIRLLKELPESVQQNQDLNANGNNSSSGNQNLDLYGMQRPEMWEPHMAGMYPGGGGMMGPRGRGVMGMQRGGMMGNGIRQQNRTEEDDWNDIQEMLSKKTYKESQRSKTGEELLDLIQRPTAKETAVAAKFKSKGGSQVKEYCSSLTKEDCRLKSGSFTACEKVHFRRIIAPHTDINLGDCSFLDTCRHMKTCKYVHYELDPERDIPPTMVGSTGLPPRPLKPQRPEYCSEVELGEPQWINCDIRTFRMDILGQFGVIMADPPWDIHMELPYGTMADDEMRNLNVPALQTDGLIFLWVTGRAMELGRECLDLWGYKRVEEIIWVKTNQLQRIIRTGRTGHWLNHSKEHCLVGLKGDPLVNRNIDTDVIVAEVRETSRKPDEMYPLLERISPRTRKLELFARMHNTQAGWMSLGNQLEGVRLVDDGLRARFKAAYPDVVVQPSSPPRPSTMEIDSNPPQARSPFAVSEPRSSTPQFAEPAAPEVAYSSEERPMAVDSDMAN